MSDGPADETARNERVLLLTTLPVPHLSGLEGREHRRVTREHAEESFFARQLDFVDVLVRDGALGRHELQPDMRRKRHYCCAFARSSTSSMLPAR